MNELGIEDEYQMMSQVEHILKRPDSYIGSVDSLEKSAWVWNRAKGVIEQRSIRMVPGLYKIFDEILVNAADNYQRKGGSAPMSYIAVKLDEESGWVSVENDGRGIPVERHKKADMWVAELIFGQLLTSSNYDDSVAKVVGGRNGYGAKLTNIYSTDFVVTTGDARRRKQLRKAWRANMHKSDPAEITSYSGREDFTRIEFRPDLPRFGMRRLDADTLDLMARRVVDVAGVSPASIKVSLDGKPFKLKDFMAYFRLYEPALRAMEAGDVATSAKDTAAQTERMVEEAAAKGVGAVVAHWKTPRWEVVGAVTRNNSFTQVSFVNGISTSRGGTHVEYIAEQIVNFTVDRAAKTAKKLKVTAGQVRGHLVLFVNALIENPTFDSQTKDTLTLRKDKFGSVCDLGKPFLKGLAEQGLIDLVVQYAKFRELRAMENKLNKGKRKGMLYVEKLEDANLAGGRRSQECTLILTEGDSAKALAMAGLEVVGRDLFGVYPLRGKMLNVREASPLQVKENKEVRELTEIMGLKMGLDYNTPQERNQLRYGHICIMADQDQDGSHIKGLVINFVAFFWPALFRSDNFLRQFITPLLKAFPRTGNADPLPFFSLQEFRAWAQSDPARLRRHRIKYYKGLGTSSSDEGREYFSALGTHLIGFRREGPADEESLELAFKKDKVAARKAWLDAYDPNTFLEYKEARGLRASEFDPQRVVLHRDFVHRELVHFSMADTVRSIPSIMDGLKPGQRKILFAVFKKRLGPGSEIKVAQLAGYVGEQTEYHHGEESLKSTIVGLAQDFVGSNNVPLLLPVGQFGTRHMGGKDHASARYIFTSLNRATRALFHPSDDRLLQYQVEDGHAVEPRHYVPVVPTVLINGSDGIGTGWSSQVPRFCPRELVEAFLDRIINDTPFPPLTPWQRGWSGELELVEQQSTKRKGGKSKGKGKKDPNQQLIMGDKFDPLDSPREEEPLPEGARRYRVKGVLERDYDDPNQLVHIRELPIRKWTKDYKLFLMSLLESNHQLAREKKEERKEERKRAPARAKPRGKAGAKGAGGGTHPGETGEIPSGLEEFVIQDLREYHSEAQVHFEIQLTEESWHSLQRVTNSQLADKLRLNGSLTMTNMVLFSPEGRLKLYTSPEDICEEFYKVRSKTYEQRHQMLLREKRKQAFILSEKARFIRDLNDGQIVLSRRKISNVHSQLKTNGYKSMEEIDERYRGPEDEAEAQLRAEADGGVPEPENNREEESAEQEAGAEGKAGDYGYLLSLPVSAQTIERAAKLEEESKRLKAEVEEMLKLCPNDLWVADLRHLDQQLEQYEQRRAEKEEKAARKARKQRPAAKSRGNRPKARAAPRPKKDKENNKENPFLSAKPAPKMVDRPKEALKVEPKPAPKAGGLMALFAKDKPAKSPTASPKARPSGGGRGGGGLLSFFNKDKKPKDEVKREEDEIKKEKEKPKEVFYQPAQRVDRSKEGPSVIPDSDSDSNYMDFLEESD